MISIPLQESLSGIPGIRGFAQCDAHGAVLLSGGEAGGALYGSAPRILHLAAELGQDLGLGALREAELHGSLHALCVPCQGGAVSVEAGSRATLADVSQRLHAVLA